MKAAAAARICRRGLFRRYAVAVLGLALSAALQTAMLYGWWTGGTAGYARAWSALTPWQITLTLAVATDCMWKLCEHFPLPRNLMVLLVAVCGVVTLTTALPASWALPDALHLVTIRRHCGVVLFVILGVSRIALVDVEPLMRRNALRYSSAMLMGMGSMIVADVIFNVSRAYWVVAAGQLVLLVGSLSAFYWWFGIDASGERWTRTPGPRPEDLDDEWERVNEALRDRVRHMRANG